MRLIHDQSSCKQAPLWAESAQVLASITTEPSFKFLFFSNFYFHCLTSNAPPPKKENPKKIFYNLLTAKETAQNHVSTKADDCASNQDSQFLLFKVVHCDEFILPQEPAHPVLPPSSGLSGIMTTPFTPRCLPPHTIPQPGG